MWRSGSAHVRTFACPIPCISVRVRACLQANGGLHRIGPHVSISLDAPQMYVLFLYHRKFSILPSFWNIIFRFIKFAEIPPTAGSSRIACRVYRSPASVVRAAAWKKANIIFRFIKMKISSPAENSIACWYAVACVGVPPDRVYRNAAFAGADSLERWQCR